MLSYGLQFGNCSLAPVCLAWENSQHLVTLPLVSPPNYVWETSAEIPFWWRITTQIWLVLVIGWIKFAMPHGQSKALPRSGKWCIISVEFLHSFLRCHLAGKPVVASPNVGCFLKLLFVQPVSMAKFNISNTRFHWAGGMSGCHETTSEEEVQKFYTDDISLPRFGM